MAKSFISTAGKKVTDIRGFLRDAAGGNSIKYSAEKGAKHIVYFPYINVKEVNEDGEEVVRKQIVAISGDVHEWNTLEGRYRATVCLKDVIRKSEEGDILLNDGTCPFCDRVQDAWDIYRYRKELEEANCKLTGEDRKKHMKSVVSTLADERKAKEARTYMYVLIVKYRTDGKNIVIGPDKLPEYDLKVMKLSKNRVEKIQQQIENSGAEMPGSEVMFEYPPVDDRRLQVSQSTTAPVFPNNMLTVKYPGLIEKINNDVSKFEWEGIENSFPEWNGMTTMEANKVTEELFEKWDEYKAQVQINPAAKYMEYITETPVTTPPIAAPTVENSEQNAGGLEAPFVPPAPSIPDVNSVFGDGEGTIEI